MANESIGLIVVVLLLGFLLGFTAGYLIARDMWMVEIVRRGHAEWVQDVKDGRPAAAKFKWKEPEKVKTSKRDHL